MLHVIANGRHVLIIQESAPVSQAVRTFGVRWRSHIFCEGVFPAVFRKAEPEHDGQFDFRG